jgi:hypothetical protein
VLEPGVERRVAMGRAPRGEATCRGIGRRYSAMPPSGSRRAMDGREGCARMEASSFPPPESTSELASAATICSSVNSRAFADPLPPPVHEPTEQSATDSCTRCGFGDPGSEP